MLLFACQKSQLPSKSSLIKDKTGDILIIKGQIPLKKDSNLLIPPEDLFKKTVRNIYIYSFIFKKAQSFVEDSCSFLVNCVSLGTIFSYGLIHSWCSS